MPTGNDEGAVMDETSTGADQADNGVEGSENIDTANDELGTGDETGGKDQPSEETLKWKALARKHERDAKANRAAAAKLAKIEDAQKTAEQRAADNLAEATARAEAAEARILRREVAIDYKLSREDAEFLDGITDEDQMRALAKRLAQASEKPKDDADDEPDKDRAQRRKTPRLTGSKTQADQAKAVAKALFAG